MRHIPLRRCVSCRESRPKAGLTRFSRDGEGAWLVDPGRRLGGRGAWVCDRDECRNERRLARFFRSQAGAVARQLELTHEERTSRDGGMND